MKAYYRLIDNNIKTFYKSVVHKFTIGDVEDPNLIAFQMLKSWQDTDQGKFIMFNAREIPNFEKHMDTQSFSWLYVVVAELEEKKLSEYILKWGINND